MNRAATLALTPLSAIYGGVVMTGNALYHRGFFRAHRIEAPVISVGNLTTGGTGKTPLVDFIASYLAGVGRRVCILTRGYRRESSGRVVVSDGHSILADVKEAGDEAFLLAEELRGRAAVVCEADRVGAARWAFENLKSDVFVLDDGFQHQRIARDLNIVAIDATNPWGNGRLLPAGSLRESPKALTRADCVVLTRADDTNELDHLREEIAKYQAGLPMFSSRTKLRRLSPIDAHETSQPSLEVAAFCGVGNPRSFFDLMTRNGYRLLYQQSFRDHYKYSQSDMNVIGRKAEAHGAQALITTPKDAVKLRTLEFSIPVYVAEIDLEIDRVKEFTELISGVLK